MLVFPAELIHALWSILRSFVKHVPEPQHMRVFKRLSHCHGGRVVCLDWALLADLLYGDNREQAKADEVLSHLHHMTAGKSAHRQHLNTEPSNACSSRYQNLDCYLSDSDVVETAALENSDSDGDLPSTLGMAGKYHAQV